jgi:predicted phage terminase large subunit-like protein
LQPTQKQLEWTAKNILIEDKASGTQLAQELIREGMHGIHKCHSTQEKSMRMLSATSTIENGFVHLAEKAHWLAQDLHELTTFPRGKHYDQAGSPRRTSTCSLALFYNAAASD